MLSWTLLQVGRFFSRCPACTIFLFYWILKSWVGKERVRDAVLKVFLKCTCPCCPWGCSPFQACCCLIPQHGVFSLLVQFALACWWADIHGKPQCPARDLFLSWINRALKAQVQDQQRSMEILAVLSRNCFVLLICVLGKAQTSAGENGGKY